jgi:signal transduction histidine kinase
VTVAVSRVLVALVALVVVTLVPTVGRVSWGVTWIGVTTVALAAGLAALRAPRQTVALALTGMALLLGNIAPMDLGGTVARWSALAALPAVVSLAGLSLVRDRLASGLLVVGALVAGPVRPLVYDPFLDPDCHACRDLPTLLELPRSAVEAPALVGGSLVVLGLVAGLRGSADRLPLAGLVAVGLWSLSGWAGVRGTEPDAQQVAAVVAGSGAVAWLVRTLVARTHLQRLAVALGSGTAPQDSLRRALRDESLTVDFAVGPEAFADSGGATSSGADPRQVTTPVLVGRELVARVHHGPDSGRADRLAASLTPELRLAIEHARLTAQLESQVRLLQASRARVVEAADETRRRLERDLHDGAQQELLALGFDVRRAQAKAPLDECLSRCVAEVGQALDDLRSLASGVHPALLTAAGLRPALEQAGRSSGHEVRTGGLPEQRFAAAVERTAYLLVVDMAARGPVEVEGTVADGSLRFRVAGLPMAAGSVVPERVAALGGTMVETPVYTEVTMPCA